MEENDFKFNQQYYKEINKLSMGAPTSAMQAKTYITHGTYTNIDNLNKTTNNWIL
jgi:hypothetical protein